MSRPRRYGPDPELVRSITEQNDKRLKALQNPFFEFHSREEFQQLKQENQSLILENKRLKRVLHNLECAPLSNDFRSFMESVVKESESEDGFNK